MSITFKIYDLIKPDFFANTISRVAIASKGMFPSFSMLFSPQKHIHLLTSACRRYKNKIADENTVISYYLVD